MLNPFLLAVIQEVAEKSSQMISETTADKLTGAGVTFSFGVLLLLIRTVLEGRNRRTDARRADCRLAYETLGPALVQTRKCADACVDRRPHHSDLVSRVEALSKAIDRLMDEAYLQRARIPAILHDPLHGLAVHAGHVQDGVNNVQVVIDSRSRGAPVTKAFHDLCLRLSKFDELERYVSKQLSRYLEGKRIEPHLEFGYELTALGQLEQWYASHFDRLKPRRYKWSKQGVARGLTPPDLRKA